MTKKFHIGDVLTVTTGRLVSLRHMEGIYDILNFLHQDSLFTHQIPRAMQDAEPWLKESVPQLFGSEIDTSIVELDILLSHVPKEKSALGKVIAHWLDGMIARYGEEFELSPIPRAQELHRSPLSELVEMVGPEKIIVVEPAK